jgi:hypothetical protein
MAAGSMNMVGWLGGGGTAPIVIGYIAQRSSLGIAIAMTAVCGLAGPLVCDGAAICYSRAAAAIIIFNRRLVRPPAGCEPRQPPPTRNPMWPG